jgi:hypothetical protein
MCQNEYSGEFSEGLKNEESKKISEKEKWELTRDKITFSFYLITLTGFSYVCCYVLINAASFPREIGWSIVTLMSLVILTFVGQLTKTPSIKHAVASAIRQFFLRISNNNSKYIKRNKNSGISK